MIDWYAFTWEAFATLVTGLAAVIGAVWIGFRQVAITRRQTEIADRQTSILAYQAEIADLAVRSDLFDRRLVVYNDIADFLTAMISPSGRGAGEVEKVNFHHAHRASKLLFRPSVTKDLDEIWGYALDLEKRSKAIRIDYPDGEVPDDVGAARAELHAWLDNRLDTLPDLFGQEMRLYQAGPTLG